MEREMTRGFGLYSGGLDSILAARLLLDQGIAVIGVTFTTPFFGSANAEKAARQLDTPLHIIDITEAHLAMVRKPKHGYGANMNPCIDCHALMFNQAGLLMESEEDDFLFSGEVLGQRPMSQNRAALAVVARESGFGNHILRPLSARCLGETPVEKTGKVDRTRLLALRGRSRKPQMAMANKYGISEYPSPAGGCLLTSPDFSARLRDLFGHSDKVSVRDIELLKAGRHLRLNSSIKLVVGRNQEENEKILSLAAPGDCLIEAMGVPSPIALIPRIAEGEYLKVAAAICVRYSDAPPYSPVHVQVRQAGDIQVLVTEALAEERISPLIIKKRATPSKPRSRK